MEIYLDNSATTRPYKEAADVVYDTMLNNYGNPSSLHLMGKRAEDLLEESRKTISGTVYCTPDEIYFTSGGTEGDNLAIIGYALANRRRGNKLITQRTEHKAVLECFKYLDENGFCVCYADVDSDGLVDADKLIQMVDDNTILVSIMAVNNETGALMPFARISKLLDHSKCALHVDAVQAYCKIPINLKRTSIDMLTVSSHKIHGPNGVGAVFVRKGIRLHPLIMGGQQERTVRSGTENLAGIAGFAKAARISFDAMEDNRRRVSALKERLADGIRRISGARVNSPDNSVYSILNVSFEGVRSEVLLHVLESKGIYVSAGSACNSKKNRHSYVLTEMGLGRERAEGAIRFSLSEFNTAEEIDYVVKVLSDEVPMLQKIMK